MNFDNLFFLNGHIEDLGQLQQGQKKQYLRFTLATRINNKPMPFFMIAFDKIAQQLAKLHQDDTIMVSFTTKEKSYLEPKTNKKHWETILTVESFTLLKTAMIKPELAVATNKVNHGNGALNKKEVEKTTTDFAGASLTKTQVVEPAKPEKPVSYAEKQQKVVNNFILNKFLES